MSVTGDAAARAAGPAGIDAISDAFTDDLAALDPVLATLAGISGHDDRLTDYSPDGLAAQRELITRVLAQARGVRTDGPAERAAKAVLLERLDLELERHDADQVAALNTMDSPPQHLIEAFDLMPGEDADQWAAIARRLAALPEAVAGYRRTLSERAGRGRVPALRQVTKVARQARIWAGADGRPSHFARLVADAPPCADGLTADLAAGLAAAERATGELAEYLTGTLAPMASAKDAVGPEIYRLESRYHLGAELDLDEAYDWAWQEFTRLETELRAVAGRLLAGATTAEVAAHLDADPLRRIDGREAFVDWAQQLSDQALEQLRGVHFELADPLMALECRLAPPGSPVGAFYTGPNDDFSRPGRMWFAEPDDRVTFPTWRDVSTIYHEGAPGHHLQIATSCYESGRLNSFQRQLCWVSGHGEGWALYAERLMHELGYLEDDADLLGMLDGQLFRAGRVIVDIGMHLEKRIPHGYGFHPGERWNPQLGLEFMLTRTVTDPSHVHDEIDRYLGWPGQAPAYKLGERLWLAARADAQRRHGSEFDLKTFHGDALRLGSMGLDALREQLSQL
jgi:uncharacterized protein (DUF885 family)